MNMNLKELKNCYFIAINILPSENLTTIAPDFF